MKRNLSISDIFAGLLGIIALGAAAVGILDFGKDHIYPKVKALFYASNSVPDGVGKTFYECWQKSAGIYPLGAAVAAENTPKRRSDEEELALAGHRKFMASCMISNGRTLDISSNRCLIAMGGFESQSTCWR